MARAKVFPIKKVGSRTFIDKHDIDAAMQSNTAWAAMELEMESLEDEEAILHSEEELDDEGHD